MAIDPEDGSARQGATKMIPGSLPATARRVRVAQAGALQSAAPGIGLMLASMACFAVSDVFAKQAMARHSGIEIAWFRYAGLAVALGALWWRTGLPPRSRQPRLQIGRGLGLVGSTLFFNLALKALPLAETTALAFASPLFVTLMSVVALHERVDRVRWLIVAVGFVGVLIVMRPGSSAFQPAALLSLVGAWSWAIGVTFARKSIAHDGVATTMAYSCAVGLALLSILVVPVFVLPSLAELGVLVMMSATWCAAQWLNLSAFHRAEASLLAPFSYSQLFWATVLGYLVFAHVPDAWSLMGIAIIIGSGAAAAVRSRRTAAMSGTGRRA
jgi:drug/metabolite transporter (DMT)-like permease